MTSAQSLPQEAKVVIIGGGVVGCSIAYHLAKLGWKDIVLLERKQLTSGTTWHAAGLIGQMRATLNMTKLAKYSADLYTGLEAETEVATGFRQFGSLGLALSPARKEEMQRGMSMAKTFGLEAHWFSPQECLDKYPYLNIEGVEGGLFLPSDGQADPANIALALAKGARMQGAKIVEGVKVTGITTHNGRVSGVAWQQGEESGTIAAPYVVNAAGMWGRQVGKMAGVNVPLQACEHFYIVTEGIPDLRRDLPVLRVPDEWAYYKEDAGKILLGAFEPKSKPWAVDGIPEDSAFLTLPDDFEHFEPVLEKAVNRVPMLENAGIATFFNGPESFTPDDRYLLGEAPELPGFWIAAGFNSIGIQSAGGAGKVLSEWMDAGEPPVDLWDVDIRRMEPLQGTKAYLAERVSETLGLLYADHYPYRQYATSRGLRRSPFYYPMKERGACFGETAGWERPNWFLPPEAAARGEVAEYRYSWGRQNWFDYAAEEHKAIREAVGAYDMTSFGKLRVEGPDACAFLQKVCGNDVDVPAGRIVYTQFLNARGGIEADVTVTRLTETAYLVVTPSTTVTRDTTWLRRHLPSDARVVITNVTAGEGVLAVMGPKARALLQALSPDDLSNEAFGFGQARTIELGMIQVRAHRVSYVGELGWELYASADQAPYMLEQVLAAGEGHGLRLCGMHTMDSCRIEKAFRHFGHDITDEDHVLEAGLGFAVKLDKADGGYGDFIGRRAVADKKASGLTCSMLQFLLEDPQPLIYHNEPIYRNGVLVGYCSSGNYGHTLGAAVGMGYVPLAAGEKPSDLLASTYEIEIAGQRFGAKASLRPLYDPKGERVKA
jgi:4-methylaminobutanoate oxidase (formaldehyde-forming)